MNTDTVILNLSGASLFPHDRQELLYEFGSQGGMAAFAYNGDNRLNTDQNGSFNPIMPRLEAETLMKQGVLCQQDRLVVIVPDHVSIHDIRMAMAQLANTTKEQVFVYNKQFSNGPAFTGSYTYQTIGFTNTISEDTLVACGVRIHKPAS